MTQVTLPLCPPPTLSLQVSDRRLGPLPQKQRTLHEKILEEIKQERRLRPVGGQHWGSRGELRRGMVGPVLLQAEAVVLWLLEGVTLSGQSDLCILLLQLVTCCSEVLIGPVSTF